MFMILRSGLMGLPVSLRINTSAFIGITLPQLIAYEVFWNYSAKSHEEDAVDGVGDTIENDCQRCGFNVQSSQWENKVAPCCHDPGI